MSETSNDNTGNYKYCSFCGKKEQEVGKLIEGRPGVTICDRCIVFGMQFLQGDVNEDGMVLNKLPKPIEIKNFLDSYVISQERAKRILSVAVYNHFKRIKYLKQHDSTVELQKSNIMLIGGTGTGKTLLAQTLARILSVPFIIADATPITEAGYVGEDVETMLQMLLVAADFDEKAASHGIIYVDELDKKARKSGANVSITRDVSGEGVQRALLRIVEGTIANVHPVGERKHPGQQFIRLDTSNILFIFGGAFDGLTDIIAERYGRNNAGFLAEKTSVKKEVRDTKLLKKVTHRDLIKYGIIPELAGRIPVIATLEELDVDSLCRVLTEPKDCLVTQYKEFLKMDGVELVLKDKALRALAQKAIDMGTGARGLRSVMEDVMVDIMFDIPSEDNVVQCIVHEDCITKNVQPTKVLGESVKEEVEVKEVPLEELSEEAV